MPDLPYELREHRRFLPRLRRLEEHAHVGIEFQPVHAVPSAYLLDDAEPFRAHLVAGVVRAPGRPGVIGMTLADHNLRVIPLEPTQHVGVVIVRRSGLGHPQAAQDAPSLLVRPFHRHGERIDACLERQVQVLRRPPPHHAHVVFFDAFSPLQANLGTVEKGLARTQAVDQGIHVGTQDLVHGLPPLVQAHRRLVTVDAVVTGVVIVDQLRFAHVYSLRANGFRPL